MGLLVTALGGSRIGSATRQGGSESVVPQQQPSLTLWLPTLPAPDARIQRAARLSVVGHVPGTCLRLELKGDRLYADCDSRLVIYDISRQALPVELGSLPITGGVMAIAVSETHAFVVDPSEDLHVIGVTRPGAMNELSVTAFETGPVRRAGLGNGLLFLGEDASGFGVPTGLRVLDVRKPVSPIEVGLYALSDVEARDLSVVNASVFVGAWSVEGVGGLYIFDAGPDGALDIRSSVVPPNGGGVTGVAVRGDRGYINVSSLRQGVSEMRVVDLADLNEPYTMGTYQFPRGAAAIPEPGYLPREAVPFLYRVSVTGDRLISLESHYGVSDGEGGKPRQRYVLRLLDVSADSSPVSEASLELDLTHPGELATSGDYAYVAGGEAGVFVVKVVR